MKILHVINSLVAAGAENLVVTLANEQVKELDISLFTFYSDKDIFDKNLNPKINFFKQSGQSYFSFKKLIKLHKLIKNMDVVHVHLFPPFYLVAFLTIFHPKVHFVYTEHSTNNSRRNWKFYYFEKWAYSRYESIICITNGVEESLKKWIGGKINTYVINNVVDLKLIRSIEASKRNDFGFGVQDKILVMVGRFISPKDQDTVLRALQLLPENHKLILIGEGPRLKEVKDLCNYLDLQKRVKFLGVRTDVFSILKICDFGIISSDWEGFGIVALEYMACSLITFGSNVSGLNEVICLKENLFSPRDFKSLASLINTVNSDEKLKHRANIRQNNWVQKFDVSTAVKEHLTVYKKNM